LSINRKRVLVIGINCFPEVTGIGRYTGELVNWLAEHQHHCTVVTGFPYYPNWKIAKPYNGNFYTKEKYKDGNLILYRCPLYVPKNPTGLKRVIQECSFFLSGFFTIIYLLFKEKHDQIICIAPPFHLGILALIYRFFKGGEILYHIQDLQIEAARDLKVLKPDWIFEILFALERFILKRIDKISTISEGMQKKVAAKINREVILFPNWVNTKIFFPIEDSQLLKAKWGFSIHDKVVLYSGSVGEKQGLEALIDIADALKKHNRIKFIICGSGPYAKKLKSLSDDKNLENLFFLPLQGNEVFNEFLNMADVHLVLQKSHASDLVMPSKLTTILAIGGLPLITANEDTSLYNLAKDHKIGIIIPSEDNLALEQAILDYCNGTFDEEKRNARIYAEHYLDKDAILSRIFNLNNHKIHNIDFRQIITN
jgi:colanic acid biosynthesis glycosyl transferase WcaI